MQQLQHQINILINLLRLKSMCGLFHLLDIAEIYIKTDMYFIFRGYLE